VFPESLKINGKRAFPVIIAVTVTPKFAFLIPIE
jgi:hypothetical protein